MARRTYKYYDLVMAAFVTVLLCSNLIGAAKVATVGPFNLGLFSLGPFTFGAGVLFFPIRRFSETRHELFLRRFARSSSVNLQTPSSWQK